MSKIVTGEQIERFQIILENLHNDEDIDCIRAFGSDMYSQGLLKGSLVTFGCAAIPAIMYLLNRVLRT